MAKKSAYGWLALAVVVAALALGWPLLEQQLAAKGGACPWPFSLLHAFMPKSADDEAILAAKAAANSATPVADGELPVFTLAELKKHDGSDPELPILLAIGGKVVDVSSGAKFYAPGKMYAQFAGTACTRALTLGSLDKKDITDDVSDLSEDKLKEMEETKLFYYDKYPVVGVLATN